MKASKLVKKLCGGVKEPAFLLKEGDVCKAKGAVVLCPVHSDDLSSSETVGQMERMENPEFVVIEVRPKKSTGMPWYRVRVTNGNAGWINSVGLIGKC